MSSTTRAIEFVPSEWETAVCGSDTLHIRYAAGELICQRGSYVAGIHLILSGVASEVVPTPEGSPGPPDLLGAGDLIGIEMLAEGANETSNSACIAVTQVELLFFERRAFKKQLLRNSALSHRILRYLASRHLRLQGDAYCAGSDLEALAFLLLRLHEVSSEPYEADLATLPESISPRMIQELSRLSGRRFRSAWDAMDTVHVGNSQIRFSREALSQIVCKHDSTQRTS